jgi:hypothetical protein
MQVNIRRMPERCRILVPVPKGNRGNKEKPKKFSMQEVFFNQTEINFTSIKCLILKFILMSGIKILNGVFYSAKSIFDARHGISILMMMMVSRIGLLML